MISLKSEFKAKSRMVIRKENIIMKKYYILISLFTFLLMGCEEDNLHKPYGPDDGIAPGK